MQTHPGARSRKPRSSRRQRVPPALTRGTELVDAISILDEIHGDLGLVLWRSARNVLLWAETPAERRAALFTGGAARLRADELAHVEVHAELRGPMSVIADLLANPGAADLLRVVNACRRISGWAEQQGALATALEFAQAAALAAPDSAPLAYAVGRLARRRAEYDRAESWYTRAAVQARQTGDWRALTQAFNGMGNLHVQRGNYPAAKRAHLRMLRVADRRGVLDMLGAAYHDLFAVEVEMQRGPEADALAEQAFHAYGSRDPRVKRLAYDVVYHWTLLGRFADAFRVGEALLPHFDDAAERAALVSLIGRAAAGVGNRARFDGALDEARVLMLRASVEEVSAKVLLGLAHGAASLGDWPLVENLAGRAAAIAGRRAEWRVQMESEALADESRTRRVAPSEPRAGAPSEAPHPLADLFVGALATAEPALAG